MQFPVIARQFFTNTNLSLTTNTYIPEGTLDAAIIEKLFQREARWLTYNKQGVLAGYDPEEDVMVGVRLALNENNSVKPEDIFWEPISGEPNTPLRLMINEGLASVQLTAQTTHSYMQHQMTSRGWTVGFDEAGNIASICRNYVANVSGIQRRELPASAI